jgi:hypothetical protein
MGKYEALSDWLRQQDRPVVRCTFVAMDDLVGGLPSSARTYRHWWGNVPSHPQARAWIAAGFVAEVDLLAQTVRFEWRPLR